MGIAATCERDAGALLAHSPTGDESLALPNCTVKDEKILLNVEELEERIAPSVAPASCPFFLKQEWHILE